MRVIIFCVFVSFFSNLVAANDKPIPVEAYGKLPSKSMLVISPKGERLAYRDTSDGKDMLVVISLTDGSVVGAAAITEIKPKDLYFISEDRLIFVGSENRGIMGYEGRHNVSVAVAFNIKTKKTHQLLSLGWGIHDGQTNISRILGLSKDRKYAYMPAYASPGQFNLYRVRLDKKAEPRVAQRGASDDIDFFLDQNAEVIARERYHNEKDLHRVVSKVDGEWKEIFSHETEFLSHSFVGFTPDRTKLVLLSQDQNHGRWAYFTMALNDGAIEGPIFSHQNKDVESVLTDLDRVVHGVRYSGFTPSYEFFDSKLNARMKGIQKVLPNNNFTIVDYTSDWSQIIFYMDGEQSSGDYLLYKNGHLSVVTPKRPEIPQEKVHKLVEYSYKARDGMLIPTLLTIPNGKELSNLPAIVMPHGGPESYDTKSFNYRAQYFASQGYLVIQPQFRGSDGFGSDHLLAGRGEWGRKMQDDLTDAVNTLAKSGDIDPDRVCIVGASYGGYAALAGAVYTPDVYKCVVSINGVSDLESMLDDTERDFGEDHWVLAYWQEVIAQGDVDDDHLEKISPINFASNVKAPVLLIHSEYDKVVPIEQSKDMAHKLKLAKKDVTFIELEKGDHHLSSAKNRMEAMRKIEAFVKKHI